MSASRTARRLLGWYPPAWRERYGEELMELIVLAAGDGPVRWSIRLDVLRAATRERGRSLSGRGPNRDPERRAREGAATVLRAWGAFVLAGTVVAKSSEHWNGVLAGHIPPLASIGFDTLRIASIVTAACVVAGIFVALPGSWALWRRTGLTARPLARAGGLAAATIAATAGLVTWANRLTPGQRAGHDALYATGFLVWALLGACAVMACAAVASETVRRRPPLGRPARRVQGALAGMIALGMTTMTVSTLVWWVAVALRSPAALVGSKGPASPWVPELIVAALVMTGAALTASSGAMRALAVR